MRITDIIRTERVNRLGGRLQERGWKAHFQVPSTVDDNEVLPDTVLSTSLHATRSDAVAALLGTMAVCLRNHDVGAKWIGATPTLGAMLYPSGDGWAYQLVRDGKSSGINGCGVGSRGCAERTVRLHLAQIMFDPARPGSADTARAVIDDVQGREEFLRWAVWQQRYYAAFLAECDPIECRRRADAGEDTPHDHEEIPEHADGHR